ncbi:hypothetical protein F4806DRAFT_503618 [Annulohypoxylon nitens]|nr:hypothetical protein F4806DRAFT_503618 [Annulohypoxylon nitens]
MTTNSGIGIVGEFKQAVEIFKNNLTENERKDFQFTRLEDVQKAMIDLQTQQNQKKRLRYLNRLKPFLRLMEDYGKVIDVFLNASEILAYVWVTFLAIIDLETRNTWANLPQGPIKFVLLTASALSKAFSSLLDMYEYIGRQIPLLSSYQSLFSENVHISPLLIMVFEVILRFHKESLRFFRQKLWKQLFDATWNSFESKVDNLKEDIRHYGQLIKSRASLVEFEQVRSLRKLAEAEFLESRKSQLNSRREAVLRWLSPAPLNGIHEHHCNARLGNPEAGKWLIGREDFNKWFHPSSCWTPLLWINGKPGAGKSVLASVIIDETKEKMKGHSISMAFFYCAESDPLRNNFVSIARGILSQLLGQDEDLILLMYNEMSTTSGDAVLSSTASAVKLLEVALRKQKTYIILDGIDECPRDQRKQTCTWFRNVVDSLPKAQMDDIRCLFISQDDGISHKDLSMLSTIKITHQDNKCDIEAFAKAWQHKIEEKFGVFKEELDIPLIVTARSQGMFIFAKCVLEELYVQPTRHALLAEWKADNFPNKLDELYERIVRRVLDHSMESKPEITKRILSWISYSKRPLRWHEIQAVQSIDLEEPSINNENLRLVSGSKDVCSSLVEVYPDQTIQLVHPTLKKFLLRRKIIDSAKVDHELFSRSIEYLCFPAINSELEPSQVNKYLITGAYSFYEYAVACWEPHLLSWLPQATPEEILDLSGKIEIFLDEHYAEPKVCQPVSKSIGDKLRKLELLETYDSIVQCIIWTRKSLMADKTQDSNDLMDFPRITTMIRSALEHTPKSEEDTKKIEKYYGIGWFKCPHIYCQRFYNGFQNDNDKRTHVDRHERPFMCTFDNCPTATFGCVCRADLDKHVLEFHGVYKDTEQFPDQSRVKDHITKNGTGEHRCSRCIKRFRHQSLLTSHMKSHERGHYKCTVCSKYFVRNADRKRHENIHKENQFICDGGASYRGSSIKWGCGKDFARLDALTEHLRSKSGSSCLEAFFEQNPEGDHEVFVQNAISHLRFDMRYRQLSKQRENEKLKIASPVGGPPLG